MVTVTQLKARTISFGGSKLAFVIGGRKRAKAKAWNILRTLKFSWKGSRFQMARRPTVRIRNRYKNRVISFLMTWKTVEKSRYISPYF